MAYKIKKDKIKFKDEPKFEGFIVKRSNGHGARVFKNRKTAKKFAIKEKEKIGNLFNLAETRDGNIEAVEYKNYTIIIDEKGREIKKLKKGYSNKK